MKQFDVSNLEAGMLLETKNGNRYVVLGSYEDDIDLINIETQKSTCIDLDADEMAVRGGRNGSRNVIAIYEFKTAEPTRNKVSECLKMGTGKVATYAVSLVWDDGMKAKAVISAQIADIQKQLADLQKQMESL